MKRFFRRYYVIEITPMKFHRFYYLVLTPVNILLALWATIDMFLHPETLDAISVIYNLAILACCVLTFMEALNYISMRGLPLWALLRWN